MKIKSSPGLKALSVAVFSIVVVTGSAAIAREIFEHNDHAPAPKVQKHKIHKEEEGYSCDATVYPVSPKDQKRRDSLLGWNYDSRPVYASKEVYVIREEFLVSDFPKKGYVLQTNGKYVLQK